MMRGRKPAVELTQQEIELAGAKSRRYRADHGITQMELAVRLRARLADISAIENGKGRDASSRTVAMILGI